MSLSTDLMPGEKTVDVQHDIYYNHNGPPVIDETLKEPTPTGKKSLQILKEEKRKHDELIASEHRISEEKPGISPKMLIIIGIVIFIVIVIIVIVIIVIVSMKKKNATISDKKTSSSKSSKSSSKKTKK